LIWVAESKLEKSLAYFCRAVEDVKDIGVVLDYDSTTEETPTSSGSIPSVFMSTFLLHD
jgi:hypothetical protein